MKEEKPEQSECKKGKQQDMLCQWCETHDKPMSHCINDRLNKQLAEKEKEIEKLKAVNKAETESYRNSLKENK